MDKVEQNGKRILCIKPKGIAAADQYLINKFFSYSQVVFNKHIVISEWMAECVVDWMRQHHAVFPTGPDLEKWVKSKDTKKEYLNFTDNMFWSALDQILNDQLSDLVPHYIKLFCEYLLHHNEPRFVEKSEVRFITDNSEDAQKLLGEADILKEDSLLDQRITIMSSRAMTSQVPVEKFQEALKRDGAHDDASADTSVPDPELSRLMECIAVKNSEEDIHLLCDDPRSLMRMMYASTLVMLRSYEFPQD